MLPADFKPQYDDSVVEFLNNDTTGRAPQRISPFYCLLPAYARVLSTFFTPLPELFYAAPTVQAPGSPFIFSHLVPWLRFKLADGTLAERNAGQLAIYWGMPGVPDPLAEANLDVATPVGV